MHEEKLIFIFVLYFSVQTTLNELVQAGCPHFDKNLLRWSSQQTWPAGKMPVHNDVVVIDRPILLDTTPPPLRGLIIEANGKLVWSPEGVFELKTRYILSRGKFELGSATCRFTQRAIITLTGTRGQYEKAGFGEKFIGVESGGSLELHGSQKMSWTKLNKTVHKISKKNGILFHHKSSVNQDLNSWFQGVAVYVIDPETLERRFSVFYLSGEDEERTRRGIDALLSFLQKIKLGNIVMLAVQNSLKKTADLEVVYDAIEMFAFGAVTGTSRIRSVGEKDAYSMILFSGDFASQKEGVDYRTDAKDHAEFIINFTLFERGLKFTAVSVIYDENWRTYVDFYIKNTEFAYPVLDLASDARSWETGDTVLLTSTDYSWTQAEEAKIIDCPQCRTNQVRIDLEPKFTHWGEMAENVDMRGEVALLSRNIVIQGEMQGACSPQNMNCDIFNYDTFGGHIMVMQGFVNVHIEGVELMYMGQQTDLGRYPIHFHMAGDVKDRNHSNHAYVRGNSIHHTFARCITVHGTDSLEVTNNVCYDCLGHAYFIEDGGERWTTLDGNFGASTKKGSLIPSDQSPSTFWIVNPLVYVRNNVAAGGEHTGFWFLFPDEPIGPSLSLHLMKRDEARHTPILEVSNNVAHSNMVTGLNIDQKLMNDSSAGSVNYYEPRVIPLDPTSQESEVVIYRMTAFKNHIQNVWIRGGRIRLERASVADSARGITFARTRSGEQFLSNSVVLGETLNTGEGTVLWNKTTGRTTELERSLHIPWDIHHPLLGFVVYDGPVYLQNVWFNHFYPNSNYTATAIGFKLQNQFSSSAVSSVTGLRFGFQDQMSSGLRIYDGNRTVYGFSDFDGDIEATIRDEDGSLSSFPGTQIVRPRPFFFGRDCVLRKHWNLAICPYRYVKLHVVEDQTLTVYQNYQRVSKPFMVRDDIPEVNETRSGTTSSDFMVILGGQYTYSLHWTQDIPRQFHICARGLDRGLTNTVRIGICMPRGATFDLHSWTPKWLPTLDSWTRVPSLEDLDRDLNGDKYFYDEDIGVLFLKFMSDDIRTKNATSDCPGHCPSLRVSVLSGNRGDSDCRNRMYPKYQQRKSKNYQVHDAKGLVNFDKTLQAWEEGVPTKWGAGDTLQRETRDNIHHSNNLKDGHNSYDVAGHLDSDKENCSSGSGCSH